MRTKVTIAKIIFLAAPVTLTFLFSISCRSNTEERRFEIKGKVESVDRSANQVTIAHQDIPGFMPAMTMPFKVKDPAVLSYISPGDEITATLVVKNHRSWLEDIVASRSQPAPEASKTIGPREPQPGDVVPDFSLINQDGKPIHLNQYRGRALLLTFIYTRCPLPDFCPLMSSNFAEIHKELQKEPALYPPVHLLSISIDTDYDTPKVLRNYGMTYLGDAGQKGFQQWEFACGNAEQVKAVADFFGLIYKQEQDQIVHSLRTVIIGPDGKVLKVYRGNEWKPLEVLSELRRLRSQ
jgi:protein SCO1/2